MTIIADETKPKKRGRKRKLKRESKYLALILMKIFIRKLVFNILDNLLCTYNGITIILSSL